MTSPSGVQTRDPPDRFLGGPRSYAGNAFGRHAAGRPFAALRDSSALRDRCRVGCRNVWIVNWSRMLPVVNTTRALLPPRLLRSVVHHVREAISLGRLEHKLSYGDPSLAHGAEAFDQATRARESVRFDGVKPSVTQLSHSKEILDTSGHRRLVSPGCSGASITGRAGSRTSSAAARRTFPP